MRLSTSIGICVSVSIVAVSASCTRGTEPTNHVMPHTLAALSAQLMTGTVATLVSPAPRALVTDARDQPLAGILVSFQVSMGNGSVAPATVATDAKGVATTAWKLGRVAGRSALTVHLADSSVSLAPVLFSADAAPGPLTQLVPVSGDAQRAVVGSMLPQPLTVRAADQYGNGVSGATVTFTVLGGGALDVSGTSTDSTGAARAGHWTLGPSAGVQAVRADVGDGQRILAFMQFSADAFACAAAAERTGCDELLFTRDDRQLYLARLDGSAPVQLTHDGRNFNASWSPDGRRIAFVHTDNEDPPRSVDLYLMDADGSHLVRRTTNSNVSAAAWSPDGRTLAIADSNHLLLLDSGNEAAPPLKLTDQAELPTWSPDGKQLAFVKLTDLAIHVIGADGTGERSVVRLQVFPGVLDWSSDGRWLAYTDLRPEGLGVYVTDPNGSATESLLNDQSQPLLIDIRDPGLSWSPVGQQLAVTACEVEVCGFVDVVRLDQTETWSPGWAVEPSWSPDGAWLTGVATFHVNGAYRSGIGYMPRDGGAFRGVVVGGSNPRWRP